MVIYIDGIKYTHVTPENEAVLEAHIEENHKNIFGRNSIYFPKKKIRSKAGIGTVPDAYVIIPGKQLKWCILEAELASHSVYDHVFPQLTKFRRAIEDTNSRRKLTEFFYEAVKEDPVLEAEFRRQIGSGEVYKSISDMVNEKPLIAVIIDESTEELEEALADFSGDVKVIEFKTFKRQGAEDINAYMFKPIAEEGKIITEGETKPSGRTGGIKNAVYALFDKKGVDGVTYEECEALAKSIKPDTAFNKNHFVWYKRDYLLNKKGETRPRKRIYTDYYDKCIEKISSYLNKRFVKKRKSVYESEDGGTSLLCHVSKAYKSKDKKIYWYGVMRSHKEMLEKNENGYAAFGCGTAGKIILMPIESMSPLLQKMNKTNRGNQFYWHVRIHEENGNFILEQPLGESPVDITEYLIQ